MRGWNFVYSWRSFWSLFMFIHSYCIIIIILNFLVTLLLFGLLLKKFILLVAILVLQTRIYMDRRLCLAQLVTHIIKAAHWELCTTWCKMIVVDHYFDALSHVVIWGQRWYFSMFGINKNQLLVAHFFGLALYFIYLLAPLHLINE